MSDINEHLLEAEKVIAASQSQYLRESEILSHMVSTEGWKHVEAHIEQCLRGADKALRSAGDMDDVRYYQALIKAYEELQNFVRTGIARGRAI